MPKKDNQPLIEALEQIAAYGHIKHCPHPMIPVDECGCNDMDPTEVASKALEKWKMKGVRDGVKENQKP